MRGVAVVAVVTMVSPGIVVVVRLSAHAASSATAGLSGAVSSAAVRSSSRAAAAGAGGRLSTAGLGCGSADPTGTGTTELARRKDGRGVAPSDAGNIIFLMRFGGSVHCTEPPFYALVLIAP